VVLAGCPELVVVEDVVLRHRMSIISIHRLEILRTFLAKHGDGSKLFGWVALNELISFLFNPFFNQIFRFVRFR
jgi:hypothetical protein